MIAGPRRETSSVTPLATSLPKRMLHRPATQIARSASSSVHHRRHFPSAVRRPAELVPLLIITLAARNLLNFHLLSEPIPTRQCPCPPLVMRNKPEIAR